MTKKMRSFSPLPRRHTVVEASDSLSPLQHSGGHSGHLMLQLEHILPGSFCVHILPPTSPFFKSKNMGRGPSLPLASIPNLPGTV